MMLAGWFFVFLMVLSLLDFSFVLSFLSYGLVIAGSICGYCGIFIVESKNI